MLHQTKSASNRDYCNSPKLQPGRLSSGAAQGLLAASLSLPVGLITSGFLTRKLGPEDYGTFAVTVTIIATIEIILNAGFEKTAVKFIAATKDWRPVATSVLRLHLLTSIIAFIVVVAGSPLISTVLGSPGSVEYLRLLAFNIPVFALAGVHLSILIARGQYRQRAILNVAYWVSRLVLILVFVGCGLSIHGALLAFIGSSAIMLIGARVYTRPSLFGPSAIPYRQLQNYALPLVLFTAVMIFITRVDLLFLKGLCDDLAVVGFYSAAKNFVIIPEIFVASVAPLLMATLSRFKKTGQAELFDELARKSIKFALCSIPFAGLAAGLSTDLVVLIYGKEFLPAASVLSILMIAAVGYSLITVNVAIIAAAGHPRTILAAVLPMLPITVIAYVAATIRFGPHGTAWAAAVSAWIIAGILLLVSNRESNCIPKFGFILRSVVLGIVVYASAGNRFDLNYWIIVILPIWALAIVTFYVVFRDISTDDIEFIRSLD